MALSKKPSTTAKVGSSAAKSAPKPQPATPTKPAPAAAKPQPAPAAKPAPAPEPAKTDVLATQQPQTQALATAKQLEQDFDQYVDHFQQSDLATPFLIILQANSPQVLEGGEGYVAGARAGMIFNTATQELWEGGEGVVVIPAHYKKTYIEWVPRDDGGGFVADHGEAEGLRLLATCSKDEKGKDCLPNGNNLVATAQHYVVIMTDEGPQPVLCPMVSTQLKKSRNWNTRIVGQLVEIKGKKCRVPMFFHSYRLTTQLEKNDQGSWYGWVIEYNGPSYELDENREYYEAAKSFREMVDAGKVNTTPPAAAQDQPAGGEEAPF